MYLYGNYGYCNGDIFFKELVISGLSFMIKMLHAIYITMKLSVIKHTWWVTVVLYMLELKCYLYIFIII